MVSSPRLEDFAMAPEGDAPLQVSHFLNVLLIGPASRDNGQDADPPVFCVYFKDHPIFSNSKSIERPQFPF